MFQLLVLADRIPKPSPLCLVLSSALLSACDSTSGEDGFFTSFAALLRDCAYVTHMDNVR